MNTVFIINSTAYSLLFYFIIYSFFGWVSEVIFALIKTKEFVNRGFLYGPFCPIYGVAALSLIIFLEPLRDNIPLLILGSFLFPSLVEYIVGFILETLFNTTWWDYSNNKFNLHGRICLKFSFVWCSVALFFLFFFQPYVIKVYVDSIPLHLGHIILYTFLIYFLVDCTFTLIALIQFKELIFELIDVTRELNIRSEIAKKLKESFSNLEIKTTAKQFSQKVTDKLGNTVESLSHKFNDAMVNLGYKNDSEQYKSEVENFNSLESKVDELKATYDKLANKLVHNYTRILKAYPNLKTKHSNGVLTDIKNKIKTLSINKK